MQGFVLVGYKLSGTRVLRLVVLVILGYASGHVPGYIRMLGYVPEYLQILGCVPGYLQSVYPARNTLEILTQAEFFVWETVRFAVPSVERFPNFRLPCISQPAFLRTMFLVGALCRSRLVGYLVSCGW